MVYRFEVCDDGKAHGYTAGTENGCEYGEMECVILRLTHSLEPGKHYVFFDNLFASSDVMIYLKARGIFAIATLRADCARGCDLTSEREMKKEGRSTFEEFVDKKNGVVISSWFDNRRVLMVSNHLGIEPMDEAKRYDKKLNEIITIPRPASVAEYNKCMGVCGQGRYVPFIVPVKI